MGFKRPIQIHAWRAMALQVSSTTRFALRSRKHGFHETPSIVSGCARTCMFFGLICPFCAFNLHKTSIGEVYTDAEDLHRTSIGEAYTDAKVHVVWLFREGAHPPTRFLRSVPC